MPETKAARRSRPLHDPGEFPAGIAIADRRGAHMSDPFALGFHRAEWVTARSYRGIGERLLRITGGGFRQRRGIKGLEMSPYIASAFADWLVFSRYPVGTLFQKTPDGRLLAMLPTGQTVRMEVEPKRG
jgi:hypothetical protein